ncbi:N-6 DNA methylase [Idiomarina sp.]|uniref:N-6 DNA methylase n=1 Tax=Idiomarina sp. TaxID=1874361 RepID=UPI003A954386
MNSNKNLLTKVFGYIRKDYGINNSMEAMEQLSLLLLTKYIYERVLISGRYDRSFDTNIFYDFFSSYRERQEALQTEFTTLKDLIDSFESENHRSVLISSEAIRSIYQSIPLKIRSKKIFNASIELIGNIDIYDETVAEEYDFLIQKMAEDSVSSGAYLSPKALINAIVKVIGPKSNESVYDPALGTGTVLIEAVKRQSKDLSQKNTKFNRLVGNDNSPFALLLGVVNIALNKGDLSNLYLKDSLLETEDETYDVIVSSVPIGKPSDTQNFEYKKLGYPSTLESMFLKHSMDKLARGGRAALIIPDGILFNSSKESVKLRKQLFCEFNLHTILSLPSSVLAPYANVKVSVIFFDKTTRRDDIWYYELSPEIRFSKKNRVSFDVLEEFIEDFELKKETAQSLYISRSAILERKDFDFSHILRSSKDSDLSNSIDANLEKARTTAREISSILYSYLDSIPKVQHANAVMKLSLKEVVKPRSGKALGKQVEKSGPYPVYGANGPIGYFDETNRHAGTLVFGRVGANCGNIHFVEEDFWLTNNSSSLEILDESTVYTKYLGYLLKSMNLNRYARGAAQPFISFDKIKDLQVALPSYEDQVKLCEHFDNIEKKSKEIQYLLREQLTTISDLNEEALKNSTLVHDS